ncbi:DNA topoisomerase IV subunit B, partial [candidate division WWE3 bacterium CG_4_9_14_3_um_filter_34_6]
MPTDKITTNNKQNGNYGEDSIEVLEGLEPVRVRPGMYIGSTDIRGLHHTVKEIIDNSVDEAIAGYANLIIVTIQKDNSVIVSDNGRGIPVGIKKAYGVSALELVMTKLHAGGKFGGSGYKVSGGLHGVGASVVNALSEECLVEVRQNGKLYHQEYKKGVKQYDLKTDEIKNSKIDSKYISSIDSGTTTYYKPDHTVFETLEFDYKTIRHQIRIFAYLTSGLKFTFIDERNDTKESFYFEGGLRSLISSQNRNRDVVHPTIFYAHKEAENIDVEIAFQYTDAYVANEMSFANNIRTQEGGTHLTGLRSALTKSLNDYGKKHNLLKNEERFSGEDTREGLNVGVSV